MTVLANPDFAFHQVMAEVLTPPPPVDYEQWAIKNVSFSDRESQFPADVTSKSRSRERHFLLGTRNRNFKHFKAALSP